MTEYGMTWKRITYSDMLASQKEHKGHNTAFVEKHCERPYALFRYCKDCRTLMYRVVLPTFDNGKVTFEKAVAIKPNRTE